MEVGKGDQWGIAPYVAPWRNENTMACDTTEVMRVARAWDAFGVLNLLPDVPVSDAVTHGYSPAYGK